MSDLRKNFDGHVRELLKLASRARRALQVFVPVATAAVAALKGFTPDDASEAWAAASMALQIALLVLIALAGAVVLFTDKSATTVVHDAQVALNERDALKDTLAESEGVVSALRDQLAKDSRVAEVSEAMRAVLDVALAQERITPEELKAWFIDLLDFLVTDKLTIFGIADEQWNFSVYVVDEGGTLACWATRRPTKREEDADHRAWREGEGHVGKAFQSGRALVCGDSSDPNVRGFFEAPAYKLADYDSDRYRSLAAIPIIADGASPYGVLVATSEVAGRFKPDDEDTFKPLQSASRTLATLISIYNLKRSSQG